MTLLFFVSICNSSVVGTNTTNLSYFCVVHISLKRSTKLNYFYMNTSGTWGHRDMASFFVPQNHDKNHVST